MYITIGPYFSKMRLGAVWDAVGQVVHLEGDQVAHVGVRAVTHDLFGEESWEPPANWILELAAVCEGCEDDAGSKFALALFRLNTLPLCVKGLSRWLLDTPNVERSVHMDRLQLRDSEGGTALYWSFPFVKVKAQETIISFYDLSCMSLNTQF